METNAGNDTKKENKMISKEMISAGIRLGIIRFVPAPNACMGTVCQIGEHWFCLSDLTAAEQSPDEYLASMTTEALADEVYETLYSFMDPDELSDEYAYYEAYLKERVEDSQSKQISHILAMLEAWQAAQSRGDRTFTCPLCGGLVEWWQVPYNGHLRIVCSKCTMRLCE